MAVELPPSTMVHRALWDILELRADFRALVKPGQREKLTENDGPAVVYPASRIGKLPRVRISREGSLALPFRTSNQSSLTVRWTVEIASGDTDDDTLADVEWVLFRAMHDWRETTIALTWKSKTFTVSVRFLGGPTEEQNDSVDRGSTGWSAFGRIETELFFTSTDLVLPE